MTQWTTLIRRHLAESLRAGVTFTRAWSLAERAYPVPSGWEPATVEDARNAFKAAYHGHANASVSILVDRDEGIPVDFPTPAIPVAPTARLCGSGERCAEPVAPPRFIRSTKPRRWGRIIMHTWRPVPAYLCPRHRAEVDAAVGRAEYRDRAEVTRKRLTTRRELATA